MVWGWIKRAAKKVFRAVAKVVSVVIPPVFNDQIDDIRHQERTLNDKVNVLNNNYRKAGSIQRSVNANITLKNQYENNYNTAKRTYEKDKYPKLVGLKASSNGYKNSHIPAINHKILTTNTNNSITNDMIRTATNANSNNSSRIESTYDNTVQKKKNIYFGMNRTNNSVLKTINNIKNKETIGNSKVKYLTEQMDTVSLLNYILVIIYIILLIIVAFSLYKIDINISTLHKIYILVFLIIYPFISIIYNRYIYTTQIFKYYG